jgi:hypothetical protein
MEKRINPLPAEDAWAVLAEAPGIIRQAELKFFHNLSDRWFREGGEYPVVLDVLRESLHERFAGGHVIEMGEFEFYRDRDAIMVISRGISEARLN